MKTYFKLLMLFTVFLFGCTQEEKNAEIVNPQIPYLQNLSGGAVKFKVTDPYYWVTSEELLTEKMEVIPNNVVFRIVSPDLKISSDTINWVNELQVVSDNGFFRFAVKPVTTVGLFRINVFPVVSDKINFEKNMYGRYFVEILPGPLVKMGQITGERFQDISPYNGQKDSNEPWVVIGNPAYASFISVGPITDLYGNLLNEGRVDISVERGHITSNNPANVSGGYAYFTYTPVDYFGDFNVTANVSGGENLLSKTIAFSSSSPMLQFSTEGDFANMAPGEEKTAVLELKNVGAIPATYLSLNVTSPFSILPEQSDSCKERGTLRSGESCLIRVFYRAGNTTLEGDGALTVYSEPRGFIGSIGSTLLRNNVVQPTNLKLSTTFVNFGSAPCGDVSSYEMYVQNTGDMSATNVQITNPPPFAGQSTSFVNISFPPKDSIIDPDLTKVINCGNEFLPKRKCRVKIDFSPTALVQDQAVVGQLIPENAAPLSVVISGYSTTGKPYGPFSVAVISPANVVSSGSMTIQPGNKAVIRAGPIKDICGNKVKDGTLISAGVSGGTLTSSQVATNGGDANFEWNVSSNSSLIGVQTITVNNGFGNTASTNLEFTGIALKISGLVDWGQYLILDGYYKRSQVNVYTVTNESPNMTATNLNLILSSPFQIANSQFFTCPTDPSQVPCCQNLTTGLGPNKSCIYPIKAEPLENIDYSSAIIVSSIDPGLNQASINTILRGKNPSVIAFDQSSYLFYSGNSSSVLSQNIQITNQGPAISYSTQIIVEYPYSLVSNSCSATLGSFTMPVGSSCLLNVQVPAGSSINEGTKHIQVINEAGVSNIRGQSELSYARVSFKNAEQFKIKNDCIGPLSLEIQGFQSLPVVISSDENISLNNSSSLTYYSNSSCTTSISSVKVLSGNSISQVFYAKNTLTGSTTMKATSSRFGFAEQTLNTREAITLAAIDPNMCIVYTADRNSMYQITPSGGYGDYVITFSDGSITSGNFSIEDGISGNKILVIATPLLAQTNVNFKITDVRGNTTIATVPTYPRAEFSNADGNLYYNLIPEGTPISAIHNYFASPFGVAPQRTYKPTLNTFGCNSTPSFQVAKLLETPVVFVNYGAADRNSPLESAINSLMQSKNFTLTTDFTFQNSVYQAQYDTTMSSFSNAQMSTLQNQLIALKDQYSIEPHGIKQDARFVPTSPSPYGSTVSTNGTVTGGTGHGGVDRVEYLMVQLGSNSNNSAVGKFILYGSWPYGTSSDLYIGSSETKYLEYGSFADYNNVRIEAGGKLIINNPTALQTSGNVVLTTIGIAGNLDLYGTIEMGPMTTSSSSSALYSVYIPKTLNINTNPVSVTSTDILTFSFNQAVGGSGGGGSTLNYEVGGNGGAGSAVGSSTTGLVKATALVGGKGANYSPANGGAGGLISSLDGGDGQANSSNQGAGGGGGYKGFHGAPLAIKIKGKIKGNGTIKAAGYDGGKGGNGGNPGSTLLAGYGGGGGAGGNGSPIWIFYKTSQIPVVNDVFVVNTPSDTTKIKINTLGGTGGLGGFGPSGRASSGSSGGTYNINFTPF